MAQRRAATEKAKATRARSWAKNQEAKKDRMAEQQDREANNKMLGSTGKQRDNELRKAWGPEYRARKREIQNAAG